MANKQRVHRLSKIAVLIFVAAGLVSSPLRAQTSTKDKIDQAVALYERFEIESARPLLQEVLSATWLQPVHRAWRTLGRRFMPPCYEPAVHFLR